MSSRNARLRGIAATLALIAFMIGVPIALLAIEAIPDLSAFTWSRLTSPDDGTLALELITAVCWTAWAIFTFQLISSIVFQIRGVRAPRLPGLVVPQRAADRLVAAAALLFVAIPVASAVLPQPPAEASVAAVQVPRESTAAPAPTPAAPTPVRKEKATEPDTAVYTVKRGDSLWRIAEERLGDGTKYVELVDLNEAVLDGRPDFLVPGTVLRVPTTHEASEGEYVVQPGDTLSEIAEDELGNAGAYPTIFKASRDTVQSNGARLTDSDVILPGWKLTLPGHPRPQDQSQPRHVRPPNAAPEAEPQAHSTPPETPTDSAAEKAPTSVSAHNDFAPSWLLPGLAGSGAVLGATLWLVLRAQRRTQLRHRRPGTIIAPPPPDLHPVEKTAHVTASALAPRVEALDAALRSLDPLPRLVTATLSETRIVLNLADASSPASPWTGSENTWEILLADVPERPDDSFPPYPLLVSIGQTIDQSFVFLNLAELRTVTVTGDAHRKVSFARHLAAELAVNPWSSVTRVDVLGLGPDLASFNLGRVHTHPSGDTDFIAQLARDLAAVTGQAEPDDFHAAIIATAQHPESVAELATAIDAVPGRSSAALVDLSGGAGPAGAHLELGADGRLRADRLGLDVIAAGLREDEARACALLLDLTLDEEVVPVREPADQTAVANLAGALVERLTEPRPNGPAGEESLLPLDTLVYADAAATTPEDIATVAPRSTSHAHREVRAADPGLDEDIARWESPVPVAPKLTLLGPVAARALGDVKATASRRPYFVELLAYLTLHPRGTTADDLASALGIRAKKARGDLSALRMWLGTDRDGTPFLPPAHQTHQPGTAATYQLHGILSDLDLFRRLRTRGQSRGAAGIADLVSALRLVAGEPFTNLRANGWAWLLEDDRLDHIMTSSIVDVGHIVTTHALTTGDLELATFASAASLSAAPYDEVAQLDMIQVERASGDIAGSEARLRDNVSNRRDDDLPPIDLPDRSAKIGADKAWFSNRTRPRRTG